MSTDISRFEPKFIGIAKSGRKGLVAVFQEHSKPESTGLFILNVRQIERKLEIFNRHNFHSTQYKIALEKIKNSLP